MTFLALFRVLIEVDWFAWFLLLFLENTPIWVQAGPSVMFNYTLTEVFSCTEKMILSGLSPTAKKGLLFGQETPEN